MPLAAFILKSNNHPGDTLMTNSSPQLPETGFVRLPTIIGAPGDAEATPPRPPIPAVIPVSKSTWWAGVKSGRYPQPVKLGPRTTAWRVEDIRKIIQDGVTQGGRT
jgi:predicted DNA-binding transcriptional regulator AlpA